MKITGSIIQAYIICPRQAWLMSRQISGDQYNEFLAIGRLIDEESFKRDKKEIIVEQNKIDFIRMENGELLIVETKKSSKMMEASKAQLLHYLYSLRHKFKKLRGEIRIPKEKKVISVDFDDKEIQKMEELHKQISELIEQNVSPDPLWTGICKKCSYLEFCWS
ncbi:MAG: CRISPR-associated protein Cas4 [Candidatus Marinimicrobia bacterium]|nr:CRISPR-associated protein Cas4 [Candidatus Neomarinimicrobiota bacterium]